MNVKKGNIDIEAVENVIVNLEILYVIVTIG